MSFSFSELKKGSLKLAPVPVDVSGVKEPIIVHQFSAAQMSVVMADHEGESSDAEIVLFNRLLIFLNGFDYVPTEEDRAILVDNFAQWQIRELYSKVLKLNGFGPDALREAEKN
ncbi:hypothetical protein [Cellvibrio mixtus]|uniref:hypothetical protein n=1 Tax=Cellvibrio mixtus TaxID=39650 RepID=UPI000587009D|nr:hypothetical protein [Cellvibrio mixtus]